MNRSNFYFLIIALLCISNIILLLFVVQKPKRHFDHDGPKNIIIEKLSFDEKQIIEYQALIDQHRKDISANDEKIMTLKKELYLLLATENNAEKSDSLTSAIGKLQKNIETTHFNHFHDIKMLCKPSQMEHFDDLTKELAAIFNHKKHRKPPPR